MIKKEAELLHAIDALNKQLDMLAEALEVEDKLPPLADELCDAADNLRSTCGLFVRTLDELRLKKRKT